MKQFISGMLVALLAIALYACTTPGGGSGGGASTGDPVLFKVNGHGVTASEFLKSNPAKQAVNEFVMLTSMKDEARKAGAQVDEKALQKEVDDFKKSIPMQSQGGQTWEDFLKQQGMTEKEFVDQKRTFALFQALLKKKANATEDEIKKVWEDDKQTLINEFAAKNHLPDSEKSKLTLDKVHDLAKERVESNKMGLVQGEVMNDIILNAKVEFTGPSAKELSDKIMGPAIERAQKQKEDMEKAKKEKEEAEKNGGKPKVEAGGPAGAGDAPSSAPEIKVVPKGGK